MTPQTPIPPTTGAQPSGLEPRIRVLVVEDNSQVRRELRGALELSGQIDVAGEAEDGLQAVHLAADLRPDVVLMDLEMPVLDGYEATRQIKARQPAVRVVVLTVHAYPPARRGALQAGADAFIVKGASLKELISQIVLNRKEKENE